MIRLELSPFDAAAILIVFCAVPGWINHRFFQAAGHVGDDPVGALASIVVIGVDALLPGSRVSETVSGFLEDIDIHESMMKGMLSFLLFAGALHVDLEQLKKGGWQIAIRSTVGVIASTVIIEAGLWWLAGRGDYDPSNLVHLVPCRRGDRHSDR